MNLYDILIQFIPSKEIRSRVGNKQVKVNNEVVDSPKVELCIQDGYWELGDFIYLNEHFSFPGVDIKDFFGPEETNIKQLEFLTGYTLISLSRREHLVFMND